MKNVINLEEDEETGEKGEIKKDLNVVLVDEEEEREERDDKEK